MSLLAVFVEIRLLQALGQRFFEKRYAGQPIGIKDSYKATQRRETVNSTLLLTVKKPI
jgi:hypothetical protein